MSDFQETVGENLGVIKTSMLGQNMIFSKLQPGDFCA